ncbi:MFS transporter [Virgibacillus halophilus]|uniref:MFS transporter n=2 Tax=Tigheibacillus halophilus TaxID=361280 RepID=A0ABU5CA85_9BACI|nr:MFS transporter [Virgibacillus halophilus]
MYTREQRAKIQGYLSSVWGISAVTGPLLGGFFVDKLSWRYVFWMNIPLGLLAMVGILLFFHENLSKEQRKIDYFGTIWIFLAISTLLVILVEIDGTNTFTSPLFWVMGTSSAVCFMLFLFQERRAAVPAMPLEIWRNRLIALANIASLTTGIIIIAITSYLPAFIQGVMGKSATIAGFTLTTMSIGWPIASTIAGRLLLKIGYRKTSILGSLFLVSGGVMFLFLTPERGPGWAGAGSFLIGAGMGMTSTSFIVGIQSNVNWNMRGTATASNMFMRSLGSALGVAFFGGILNSYVKAAMLKSGMEGDLSIHSVNQLLDPNEVGKMSDTLQTTLKEALSSGLHMTFSSMLILALVSAALIWFLPSNEIKRHE